jgi:hypothetical protein
VGGRALRGRLLSKSPSSESSSETVRLDQTPCIFWSIILLAHRTRTSPESFRAPRAPTPHSTLYDASHGPTQYAFRRYQLIHPYRTDINTEINLEVTTSRMSAAKYFCPIHGARNKHCIHNEIYFEDLSNSDYGCCCCRAVFILVPYRDWDSV